MGEAHYFLPNLPFGLSDRKVLLLHSVIIRINEPPNNRVRLTCLYYKFPISSSDSTTASSGNQTLNEKHLAHAESGRNEVILDKTEKAMLQKVCDTEMLSSLASISAHVSTQVLSHANPFIKFKKSLEHQQNMPLTFLVNKDLISTVSSFVMLEKWGQWWRVSFWHKNAAYLCWQLQTPLLFSHLFVFQTLLVRFHI